MKREEFDAAVDLLTEHGLARLERSLAGSYDQVQMLRSDIESAERILFKKMNRARWALTGQRSRSKEIKGEDLPYLTHEFKLVGDRAPVVQAVIGQRIKALNGENTRLDGYAGFRLRQMRREARLVLSLEGQVADLESSYELISIAIDMGYHLVGVGLDPDHLDETALKALARAYPVVD